VDEVTSTRLALLQTGRGREWELRRGDDVVARLSLPTFRRGGTAVVGGRELEIDARGVLKTEHRVLDAVTGEELARISGRQARFEGGGQAEWKSLGRGAGSGFVGRDGEPWLRAKVRTGLFRSSGEIEVAAGHDVAIPALLAVYLLIRKAEQAAGAAGAIVVAT
jgi:hypothetical protein